MRLRSILIGIFVIGCIALVGVALFFFKQAQDQTVAQFGQKAVDLCNKVSSGMSGNGQPSDVSGKLAIISASTLITEDSMFNALPADRRAKTKDEVAGVVCTKVDSKVYDTDTYSNSSGSKSYTCTRYQSVTTAYLFDGKSGDLIATRDFEGDIPPQCPEKTNKDLSEYGSAAEPKPIIDWLTS